MYTRINTYCDVLAAMYRLRLQVHNCSTSNFGYATQSCLPSASGHRGKPEQSEPVMLLTIRQTQQVKSNMRLCVCVCGGGCEERSSYRNSGASTIKSFEASPMPLATVTSNESRTKSRRVAGRTVSKTMPGPHVRRCERNLLHPKP